MNRFRSFFNALVKDTKGQDNLEYLLLAIGLGVALLIAVPAFGEKLKGGFTTAGGQIDTIAN